MPQRILITGASQGIGRALAVRYAERGDYVLFAARNENALNELCDELQAKGHAADYVVCDVTSMDAMQAAVDFMVDKAGGIDLAILNAGVGGNHRFGESKNKSLTESVKNIFDVNVFGLIHGFEAVVPVMIKQGYGKIAGVSSLADARGFSGSGAYCASKAAATHLLEAARLELKRYGIEVITIRPGFVKTNMTAKNNFNMPLLMEASKSADIIASGIDKGKKRIAFPLPMAVVSGIAKAVPDVIYEFVAGLQKDDMTDDKIDKDIGYEE